MKKKMLIIVSWYDRGQPKQREQFTDEKLAKAFYRQKYIETNCESIRINYHHI